MLAYILEVGREACQHFWRYAGRIAYIKCWLAGRIVNIFCQQSRASSQGVLTKVEYLTTLCT